MEAWIPITIAAAFLQNARSALQQRLKAGMRTTSGGAPIVGAGWAATFARFGYGAPFAALFLALAAAAAGPEQRAAFFNGPPPSVFAVWIVAAGAAQIAATWALLRSFDFANFAIGTTFSKTEPALAAAIGATLLAEFPSAITLLGLALGLVGVALAARTPLPAQGVECRAAAGGKRRLAARWGVGAAALFGFSAVGFRAASLSLETGDAPLRAAATLAAATAVQATALGAWLAWRRRPALAATLAAWRPGLAVGALGAAASAGWFTAMTLEPAAHVRALAQVELIFTVGAAWLYFKDPPSRRELIGVALVGVGAACVALGAG